MLGRFCPPGSFEGLAAPSKRGRGHSMLRDPSSTLRSHNKLTPVPVLSGAARPWNHERLTTVTFSIRRRPLPKGTKDAGLCARHTLVSRPTQAGEAGPRIVPRENSLASTHSQGLATPDPHSHDRIHRVINTLPGGALIQHSTFSIVTSLRTPLHP